MGLWHGKRGTGEYIYPTCWLNRVGVYVALVGVYPFGV